MGQQIGALLIIPLHKEIVLQLEQLKTSSVKISQIHKNGRRGKPTTEARLVKADSERSITRFDKNSIDECITPSKESRVEDKSTLSLNRKSMVSFIFFQFLQLVQDNIEMCLNKYMQVVELHHRFCYFFLLVCLEAQNCISANISNTT